MQRIELKVLMLALLMMTTAFAGCLGGDEEGVDDDDTYTIIDDDQDGVPNTVDLCLETTAGAEVDHSGCEIIVVVDSDNDGIPDEDDNCDNTPAGATIDAYGCEVVVVLDSDGDGVPDDDDDCADTPTGDNIDENGCTIAPAIEVDIGLLAPVSTDSELADTVENSVRLAIAEMNAEQNVYEFSLMVEDSGADASSAASAAQNLVAAGVVGIVGASSNDATMAAMTVAKDAGIPIISYGATSPVLTSADDGGFLWRTIASTSYEGAAGSIWAQLAQQTNVALFSSDSVEDQAIAATFTAGFNLAGGTICTSSDHTTGETDFSTDVTDLKALWIADTCGAVIILADFTSGAAIMEELNAQEMLGEEGITVIGHHGIGSADFADEVSDVSILDGVYGSRAADAEMGAAGLDFNGAYNSEYGAMPGMFGANAYDAANLLMLGVTSVDSTSGTDINGALAGLGSGYDGASGGITFDAIGDIPGLHFEFWKFTYENNGITFEIVATWGPETGIWANCRISSPIAQVGLLADFTGEPELSSGYEAGVTLAAMLVNVQQRQICFEMVRGDTMGTATGARVAAQDLVDAGVYGIVGAANDEQTIAAGEIAADNSITLISYGATSPEITSMDDGSDEQNRGYVWRVVPSDAWPAQAAGATATELGHTAVASMRLDDASGQIYADSLSGEVGSICSDQSYGSGDDDMSAQAAAIVSAGCDSVVLQANTADASTMVQALDTAGFSGDIIGHEALDNSAFSSRSDIYVVASDVAASDSALAAAFVTAFQMNYGTMPTHLSAESADACLLIALSYIYGVNFGGTDSRYVNWFIPAIADEYAGASGILTVNDAGDMVSKGVFEISNYSSGTLTAVYTWEPEDGIAPAE